jgi:hypothetical protein
MYQVYDECLSDQLLIPTLCHAAKPFPRANGRYLEKLAEQIMKDLAAK